LKLDLIGFFPFCFVVFSVVDFVVDLGIDVIDFDGFDGFGSSLI